ncbi:hypothetical protein DRQ29_02830 [bacterium]|nr:MAG: hypothetical protein DRQ29_02830 [bacterium]
MSFCKYAPRRKEIIENILHYKFYISFPRNKQNGITSRNEATRNLLNNNDLKFLACARNDKILYFAGFIILHKTIF